jgi:sugar phosphate isomerase/epimerase
MQLGIFSTVFPRTDVDEVFAAIAASGLTATQFHWDSAGLETLPAEIPDDAVERVRAAAARHNVTIAAIEGTFNMAHPDPAVRADGLRRLDVVAASAHKLGCPLVTLCTGTRDRDSMWRRHPDNDTAEAWRDMLTTMEKAVQTAESYDLGLGLEPEVSNVMSSPRRARRLLDELKSARLKIVFDGANLFDHDERRLDNADEVIAEAADLLGPDIALAHAKDVTAAGRFVPVGLGDVPWRRFISALRDASYEDALIMHSLDESDVPGCTEKLRDLLR